MESTYFDAQNMQQNAYQYQQGEVEDIIMEDVQVSSAPVVQEAAQDQSERLNGIDREFATEEDKKDIGYPGMMQGEDIDAVEVENEDYEDDFNDPHFQERMEQGFEARKNIATELSEAGEYMKEQLDDIRQNRPELIVSKEEAMKDENSEFFALGLVSELFTQLGYDNEILREAPSQGYEEDKATKAVQQALLNTDLLANDVENFRYDFGEEQNDNVLYNSEEQEKFIKEQKKNISEAYGIDEHDFDIIGIKKGSIFAKVAFYSYDYHTGNRGQNVSFQKVANDPKNKPEMEVENDNQYLMDIDEDAFFSLATINPQVLCQKIEEMNAVYAKDPNAKHITLDEV